MQILRWWVASSRSATRTSVVDLSDHFLPRSLRVGSAAHLIIQLCCYFCSFHPVYHQLLRVCHLLPFLEWTLNLWSPEVQQQQPFHGLHHMWHLADWETIRWFPQTPWSSMMCCRGPTHRLSGVERTSIWTCCFGMRPPQLQIVQQSHYWRPEHVSTLEAMRLKDHLLAMAAEG